MARITHLEERAGRWYFLFQPEAGETFEGILQLLKWRLSVGEREWHADLTRWSVAVSDEHAARLEALFPNFPGELHALKNQLTLFAI